MTMQPTQHPNYYPILVIVQQLDDDLAKGIRHYRTRSGRLLTTLDEVVRAVLGDDLVITERTDE